MYDELQPLAMTALLLCCVVILLLLVQRLFKKTERCSPLGFILSLATVAAGITILAVTAVAAFYESAVMDKDKWIAYDCQDPDIQPGGGAIAFILVICLGAISTLLFIW